MQITITATLLPERALILAKEKGYSETIVTTIDSTVTPFIIGSIPNPETPYEFLKRVYEALIIQDATKNFIQYDDLQNQALWLANEEAIKASVIASISSSVV